MSLKQLDPLAPQSGNDIVSLGVCCGLVAVCVGELNCVRCAKLVWGLNPLIIDIIVDNPTLPR